jgi:hypothetical protein
MRRARVKVEPELYMLTYPPNLKKMQLASAHVEAHT